MRLVERVALSISVALVALLAGSLYTQIPVPRVCGDGGVGLSNADRNLSAPTGYGAVIGLSWAPGDSVSFSWSSANSSSVTLVVLDPGDHPIYNDTGTAGSGSFTVGIAGQNQTYDFALPYPPPIEAVSVNYHCTTR